MPQNQTTAYSLFRLSRQQPPSQENSYVFLKLQDISACDYLSSLLSAEVFGTYIV